MASIVTCIAPVNIAVIKYWGKKDEKLIIPLNDSLSGTLSMDQMHAKTTIMASPNFTKNCIWLNGKEETFDNIRLLACLKEIKRRAQEDGTSKELLSWNIHVCSENNFPTAAGLASSAAGYACFVFALAKLYKVKGDVSQIARQGSGSACRSLEGGFVRWHMGKSSDGSDSLATQVVPASHWPEMHVIILVVNDKKKKVSSTSGMQRSVETSDLLKHRVAYCVPKRIVDIEKAIKSKDFPTFAEITMKDSNQFHAVALDTFPPAVYMNDVSHSIVDLIHCFNKVKGCTKVAYTFDAGPNACLYLLEPTVAETMAVVDYFFPSSNSKNTVQGLPVPPCNAKETVKAIEALGMQRQGDDLLKYVIHTQIGEGAKQLMDSESHLLSANGIPLRLV
ncbi:Diphosphomevalonate decarboxylase [Frankliniella fusca]|uniref:Diphosphomevalonate decarboxylase n=1 Tax=Frankliniella fusca TaxID=407009 RepID=A0AAE1GR22_9NEOP|nr:Diphosphomevalonate decarboxylase [Frankliniella fusca]